ncbi:MAG: cytochrome P450 [Anaerolineaceae bacterium]|nr:cytochrome P450 [Anaerolineaceae bacterium]
MTVNLATRELRTNPYPTYQHLRKNEPLATMQHTLFGKSYLITRYDDAVQVFKDPRFTNDRRKVKEGTSIIERMMPNIMVTFQSQMLSVDDPDHRRQRDLVHKAFTPKMIEQMAVKMEGISAGLLDKMNGKPTVDMVGEYALQVPLTVISDMMGVPHKDRAKFHHWSAAFLEGISSLGWRTLTQLPTMYRMVQFFRRLIDLRTVDPQDDLITGLVRAEQDGDRLSKDELVSMIFLLLLAGHETTVNLIANGTLALLENPDQLQKLQQNPALMDSAIEEILRYSNPVEQIAPRWVLEDVELHGQIIPRGSTILVSTASANRDETAFDKPDTFDIERQPNKHLAFGLGIHYCLGAPLARMEGKIALDALLNRYPKLELAVPSDQLQWRGAVNVRGLKALPVRLNA